MLVFEEKGKPEYPEKNLSQQLKGRTNNRLNPCRMPGKGIECGPHWWMASALTTVPPLLSDYQAIGDTFGADASTAHEKVNTACTDENRFR